MEELYLEDLLHVITQGLLYPVMIALVVFAAYSLWALGSVIVETFRERIHFKENLAHFVNAIHDAPCEQLETIIMTSGLLVHQKQALITVVRNMGLPADDLNALAVHELQLQLQANERTLTRTSWVAKIAPTCGMLGTLIPLSTGMASLEFGDMSTLATSFLTVFDTTAVGLVESGICITVNTVRKRWYAKYAQALDNYMKVVLQKAEDAHEADAELPHGYVYDSASIRENRRAVKETKKQQRKAEKAAKRGVQYAEVEPQPQPVTVIDYQVPYYQPAYQQPQYAQPVQQVAQPEQTQGQAQSAQNQQAQPTNSQPFQQPMNSGPIYGDPQNVYGAQQPVQHVYYQPHSQGHRR